MLAKELRSLEYAAARWTEKRFGVVTEYVGSVGLKFRPLELEPAQAGSIHACEPSVFRWENPVLRAIIVARHEGRRIITCLKFTPLDVI